MINNEIVHNFCESRLNNNNPPEIFNAYSSLIISLVPLFYGLPKNDIFYNVAIMFFFTGFSSFYYHYTLNFTGKQADEIPMILSTYYGIWAILKIYLQNNMNKVNKYNAANNLYMLLFIIVNTIKNLDFYFPFLFTSYIFSLLFLINKVSKKYNIPYKKNLFISLFGAICWLVSELHCTENTKYGHVVWHLFFPLGFYRLILEFDKHIQNQQLIES